MGHLSSGLLVTKSWRSSKCWHISLYTSKKSYICSYNHSLEKSFNSGKLSGYFCQARAFQNANFLWKTQILSLAVNTAIYFLNMTSSLCSFSRKCLPNTQCQITRVCLSTVLSSKLGVPWGRVDSLAFNLNSQPDPSHLSVRWKDFTHIPVLFCCGSARWERIYIDG